MTTPATGSAPAKKRMRSREHPTVSARECVDLAATVKQYGGRMGVEDFAKAHGYKSATTGLAISKIASPRYFGLFKRERNELTATELLDRLVTPMDDAELVQAKLETIANVGIYQEFLDAIGRTGIKRVDVVRNIAQRRLGIQQGAVSDFVSVFVDSVEWAGLGRRIDDGTFEVWEARAESSESADAVGETATSISQTEAPFSPTVTPQSSQNGLSGTISPSLPAIHLHFHMGESAKGDDVGDMIQSIIQRIKDGGASPE